MHVPVLAEAVVHWLNVRPEGTYVDCTAGAGGHSALIAERLSTGRLIAIDRDPAAVDIASERLAAYSQARVVHGNYGELNDVLGALGIARADGILIDAGMSSMQIDEPERGFSFQAEGPLDMRMNTVSGPTAAEYLADVTRDELAETLKAYGDLRQARKIATAICDARPLTTTTDLVNAVHTVFSFVQGMPDETRMVFQAIRIAINDELRWLQSGVDQALDCLAPRGRFVGISFHSAEDRILKNTLRAASRPVRVLHGDGRLKAVIEPRISLLTRKPVLPSDAEIAENSRAHSAKLRAAEAVEEASNG